MKTVLQVSVLAAISILANGCVSTGASIGGLETDKLVRYDCEGKDFSARAAEDFSSVRVRTPEGSVNLDRTEGNEFKGDGWTLKTAGGLVLMHKDKVVAQNCKKEA
jgi:hypothetical protein